ncbi:rRNA-processing protein UTP23 homolog [Rhodamnia argentea]|uniref:rRNA-processing protein UTP23 homolog n=1 Tax=Rhodamnia argentea TaxID=178133 RepID=A0A8B8MQU8_9MYRT|nr:rRNA-processing protein UTP23 homolog [Rhodamnia argentea]XP_048127985.1 rRNA-processing protein UTP23 homolog [Rhodamnia argentea]
MRVRKQRRHRKAVRFYTACFGFRQPFRVLCDGTFVHNLVVNKIAPADKAISDILSAPVKLYTTRCVLNELRRLGDSHAHSLEATKNLVITRCDHEGRKKADSCILEIIGEKNPQHFFVATQDTDLRRKLLEIPGVPAIYGLRNALFLEQPSASQRQFVKTSEEGRLHMTELEHKMLKRRTTNILGTKESADSSDEQEDFGERNMESSVVTKLQAVKKEIGVKDKVQFKRKKAKGPNPLSCLKKKTYENAKPSSEKERKDGDGTVRSRSRKRRRSRKGKTSSDTGN